MSGSAAAGPSASSRPGDPPRLGMDMSQGLNKLASQGQDTAMNPPGGIPLSLYDWYLGRDGPWDPLGTSLPAARLGTNRSQARSAAVIPRNILGLPGFTQYRTTNVPSDCSTIPPSIPLSDSGYVSGHHPSVGNQSVSGDLDRATDTHSLVGRMDDIGFYSPLPPGDYSNQGNIWNQPADPLLSTAQATGGNPRNLVCRVCNSTCKTPSELKKHEARHSKPHRCPVPRCNRTEGFSTTNDLARHIRSRHPSAQADGCRYKCTLGPCANVTKIWPRADNFRQHLKRKHDGYVPADVDEFIYRVQDRTRVPSDAGDGDVPLDDVGSDPATIQTLTSGAVRPGEDASRHATTTDIDFGYPDDVSLMVGHQFRDMAPAADDGDQDGVRGDMDAQSLNTEPEGLHARHGGSQSRLASGDIVLVSTFGQRTPDGSSKDSTREHGMRDDVSTGLAAQEGPSKEPRSQQPPTITVEPARSRSHSIDSDSDLGSGGPEDMDVENESDGDPTDGHDDTDAPGEADTVLESDGDAAPHASTQVSAQPEVHELVESRTDGVESLRAASSSLSTPVVNHGTDGTGNVSTLAKFLKALEEVGDTEELHRVLEKLGYEKARSQSTKSKKPSSTHGTTSGPVVRCKEPGCDSTFNRECELRKHMRRHERPYGCTDRYCSKRFGSKSDWKRHENSQHHQMDVWRCDQPAKEPLGHRGDAQVCGKVCHRRETFKAHLQKDHRIQDSGLLSTKLESCRFGKNSEAGFWCGFCLSVVETTGKKGGPGGGWTERYDHIDAHLFGRGLPKRKIEDWRHVDKDGVSPTRDEASSISGLSPSSPSVSRDFSTPDGYGRGPSTTPSSSSNSEYPGDKRGPGVDGGESSRRQKRSRTDKPRKTFVWFCCQCELAWNNLALAECCTWGNCEHRRCPDCHIREPDENVE